VIVSVAATVPAPEIYPVNTLPITAALTKYCSPADVVSPVWLGERKLYWCQLVQPS
jgi:hypothetical protein